MASFASGFARGFLGEANERFDERRAAAAERDKMMWQLLQRRAEKLEDAYMTSQQKAAEKTSRRDQLIASGVDPVVADYAVANDIKNPIASLQKTQAGVDYGPAYKPKNYAQNVDELYAPMFSRAKENIPEKYRDRYKLIMNGLGVDESKLRQRRQEDIATTSPGFDIPPPEGPMVEPKLPPDKRIIDRTVLDKNGNKTIVKFVVDLADPSQPPQRLEGVESTYEQQPEWRLQSVVDRDGTTKEVWVNLKAGPSGTPTDSGLTSQPVSKWEIKYAASEDGTEKAYRYDPVHNRYAPLDILDKHTPPDKLPAYTVWSKELNKTLGPPIWAKGAYHVLDGDRYRPIKTGEELISGDDATTLSLGDAAPKADDEKFLNASKVVLGVDGDPVGSYVRKGGKSMILPFETVAGEQPEPIIFNPKVHTIVTGDSLDRGVLNGAKMRETYGKLADAQQMIVKLDQYKKVVMSGNSGVELLLSRVEGKLKAALGTELTAENVLDLLQDNLRAQNAGLLRTTYGDANMSNYDIIQLLNAAGGDVSIFRSPQVFNKAVNSLMQNVAASYNKELPMYNYSRKRLYKNDLPQMDPIPIPDYKLPDLSKEMLDKDVQESKEQSIKALTLNAFVDEDGNMKQSMIDRLDMLKEQGRKTEYTQLMAQYNWLKDQKGSK